MYLTDNKYLQNFIDFGFTSEDNNLYTWRNYHFSLRGLSLVDIKSKQILQFHSLFELWNYFITVY